MRNLEAWKLLAGLGLLYFSRNINQNKITSMKGSEPTEAAYQKMLVDKNGLAIVYDNQQFVGVLDLDNILEFIMIKNAQRNNTKNKHS